MYTYIYIIHTYLYVQEPFGNSEVGLLALVVVPIVGSAEQEIQNDSSSN